ncbi:MAG: NUDIX domain-containing protein [Lachnospiraceae bacterium]|nr:NUDIX domain-containing protein [Lachnospiraceae bacterium]
MENGYWFDSFASCVIVLTYNEFDEIVLCRQGYLSDKYTSVTSGYITPGENAEETALREVKEELGIELESLEYAGTTWFAKNDMLMHGYVGFVHKCDLKLSEEIDSAEWVHYAEAPKTMFPDSPGNALHEVYRKFLEIRGL